MDVSRSDATEGPMTVTIRQAPEEIFIETTQGGSAQAVRYVPETAKPVVTDETAGTFRWEGSQLVTHLVAHINKQAVTVAEVRKLNAEGTEMSVAVTLVVQHGYSGTTLAPGAKNPPNTATGTNLFVKAR